MLKKNLKLITILLIVLAMVLSFSFSFADEKNETTTAKATSEQAEEQTTEDNIHQGDLYLFDTNVVMDQLVDGNVFIIGNNVKITGQVNGNLYVLANTVSFDKPSEEEECYIRYDIFACAQSIYYNAACNDLYVATNHLEMTYNSYVIRDVKAVATSTILKAAIGRDVDLQTNSINFGEDKEVPIIYGNLRYSANEEKTLSDGIVMGDISYNANNNISSNKSVTEIIKDIVITFLTAIATTVIIYLLLSKLRPEAFKNITQKATTPSAILKCIGIGLITIIAGFIATILLLISNIGVTLAAILIMILVIMGLISIPIAIINISNIIKDSFKLETNTLSYVVLVLVTIVAYGISYIPYIGGLITCLLIFFGYGAIINSFLPQKELSEEEKQAKLEAKAAKKAKKEAAKAEKKANKDSNK